MARSNTGSLRLDWIPPEIAEMILELLEESTDILNVFEVLPSLNGQVLRKRQEWLIDQVAPLIFPWLDKKEVLNCRLVCWRWSRGIDKFLENSQLNGLHPSREASRAQTELISKIRKFDLLNDTYHYNWKKFQELNEKMPNRPSHRNPFIGRKVNFHDGTSFRGRGYEVEWNEAILFPRDVGAHIWHFKLYCCWDSSPDNASSQIITRILSLLPNLRSLEIFPSSDSELRLTEAEVEQFQSTVHLPHLEALNVLDYSTAPAPLIHLIIQRFSQQITSLQMDYSAWREDYSQIFPHLTELTLRDCNEHVDNVRNMLAELNAPNLLKLELELRISAEPGNQFKSSIVSLLQPFRKLISFKVYLLRPGPCVMRMEGTMGQVSSTPVSMTSLKSLSVVIRNKELCELVNLEFFKCFPNLSYIDVDSSHTYQFMNSPTINPYDRSIWEVGLPKLLEFNLGRHGRRYKCVNRANYEWFGEGRM